MSLTKTDTRLFYDMPRDIYDAMNGVHFSSLKWFSVSPRHYAWWSTHTTPDSASFALGRAIHMALLEPSQFDRLDPVERKKRGSRDVSESDYETALAVRTYALSSDRVRSLLSGRTEVSVLWRYDGLDCKARLDVLSGDGRRVVELKSTRTISAAIGAVRRYHYHAQLAWYCDAVDADEAAIVFVETQPPYDTAILRLSDKLLDEGREIYRGWFRQLQKCRVSGEYPGVGEISLDESEAEIDLGGLEDG